MCGLSSSQLDLSRESTRTGVVDNELYILISTCSVLGFMFQNELLWLVRTLLFSNKNPAMTHRIVQSSFLSPGHRPNTKDDAVELDTPPIELDMSEIIEPQDSKHHVSKTPSSTVVMTSEWNVVTIELLPG